MLTCSALQNSWMRMAWTWSRSEHRILHEGLGVVVFASTVGEDYSRGRGGSYAVPPVDLPEIGGGPVAGLRFRLTELTTVRCASDYAHAGTLSLLPAGGSWVAGYVQASRGVGGGQRRLQSAAFPPIRCV